MLEITIYNKKYMMNAIVTVAGNPSSVKLQALNKDGSSGSQILYVGHVGDGITDNKVCCAAQALFKGLPPEAFEDFPKNMPEEISLSMKVINKNQEETDVTHTLRRGELRS